MLLDHCYALGLLLSFYYLIKVLLAQLVEYQTLDLRALGSSTTVSKIFFFILHFVAFDALLAGAMQMKSSMPFIRGIKVHRKNYHLKEKWRRY